MFGAAQCNEVVAVFEDALLVMRKRGIMRLSNVEPRPSSALVGQQLGA
jgi:hypothetical protein